MSDIYVQFTDENHVEIKAVFGCMQDESEYPNQALVELSDPRYLTFYNGIPALSQQFLPLPTVI